MNTEYNQKFYQLIDNLEVNNQGNKVISGLSIKMALTLLLNGAEGESKTELEKFLGLSLEEANANTKKILDNLGNTLTIANSVWYSEPNTIKEEYKSIIKEYQNADIMVEDFNNPSTVDKVNSWVSSNTNNLINHVIDNLKDITSLLINTIYFKDNWYEPINEEFTQDKEFYGKDKESIVPMMSTSSERYLENEHAKAFALSYANSPYTFIGVLPNNNEFNIESLNLDTLEFRRNVSVDVKIPRLDIDFDSSLKNALNKLGINAVFNNDNDFNKMLDIPQKIEQIIHKVKFKLNEEGTEAAAATVANMKFGALPSIEEAEVIELNFNRPFVFMIKNNINNEILFIGEINNI